jgi:putative toxin-antitoxin system antitoxin component (TIGR02293 family)
MGASRQLRQREAERILRLADIAKHTVEAFGDSTEAGRWLSAPNFSLVGEKPLAFIATDVGAGEVRCLIAAISQGAVL